MNCDRFGLAFQSDIANFHFQPDVKKRHVTSYEFDYQSLLSLWGTQTKSLCLLLTWMKSGFGGRRRSAGRFRHFWDNKSSLWSIFSWHLLIEIGLEVLNLHVVKTKIMMAKERRTTLTTFFIILNQEPANFWAVDKANSGEKSPHVCLFRRSLVSLICRVQWTFPMFVQSTHD